jgi:hypothetical protein
MSGANLHSQYAFMAWFMVKKHHDNFTFTFTIGVIMAIIITTKISRRNKEILETTDGSSCTSDYLSNLE